MRRFPLLIPVIAVVLALGTPVGALPSQGSQELVPVGGAPGGGWTSSVQANGGVYAVGVIHLEGALPDTTYTVLRRVHSSGVGSCSNFVANFTLPFATVTTGPTGNGTASTRLASSAVDQYPFLHGLTVGQIIEVLGPGGAHAYSTPCLEFTMH